MLPDLLKDRFGGAWQVRALGTSTFCDTWRADGGAGALFVKTVPAARAAVLEAEADGLLALAVPGCLRVPAVAGCWTAGGSTLLAMERLDFAAREPVGFGERFGRALGALHRAPAPGTGRFGWHRDNWLGGTPQANQWHADWLDFLAHRRLRPLAAGLRAPLPATVGRVIAALPGLFDDGHRPLPSLVHGDLWSGNWAALPDGTPVVYDPAVSVSDAEAELAMMELFGTPPGGFWTAYDAVAPRAPGYAWRRPVYQLVHLLNHARLFGGGYLGQALAVAQAIVDGPRRTIAR